MTKYLLLGLSILLFCTAAQGLVCRVCKFKPFSFCWFPEEACQAAEGQFCETTTVYAGNLKLYTKYGCGKYAELCNRTEDRDTLMNRRYERTCCNSDLCIA